MTPNELYKYLQLISEGREQEAYALREKGIPDILRTYISLDPNNPELNEKKFSTLKENKLWFASTTTLNDPYELKGFRFDMERLKRAGLEGFIDKIDSIWKDYGLICFTDCPIEFLPMWAYYANNHCGFLVEYEIKKKAAIHEVSYESERVDVTGLLLRLIEEGLDAHKKGLQNTPESKALTALLLQNLYFKSIDWAHEKEFRIVQSIHGTKGENLPLSNFGMRVSKIVAGMNCESIHELNNISNALGCGNVWCSRQSEASYGLEVYQYDAEK